MTCTTERARYAALTRHRSADDPDVEAARRDFTAAHLSDYITKTVAAGGPLTAAQRDQLAVLLRGGGTDAA